MKHSVPGWPIWLREEEERMNCPLETRETAALLVARAARELAPDTAVRLDRHIGGSYKPCRGHLHRQCQRLHRRDDAIDQRDFRRTKFRPSRRLYSQPSGNSRNWSPQQLCRPRWMARYIERPTQR